MKGKFTLLLTVLVLSACSSPQGRACRELGDKHVAAQTTAKTDYTLIDWTSFYSKKYDACIHTEQKKVGTHFFIGDLSHTILRGHFWGLLNCDETGADRVIISAVKKFNGLIDNVPSAEYMDDGSGGPPRTLKTPNVMWTKERCAKVFEDMIADLKS